ncbi:MAG: flippase-like domain-containing protein [Deltaproteobacteria bacterium]|nr:flippase-like domain-containing protein [Deltaproteobacteria bacterium]
MKKKVLIHAVSWILSLGIIAVLLWLLDARKIVHVLAGTSLPAVAGIMALIVVMLAFKGVRWWIIVRTRTAVSLWTCVRLSIVGLFINAFIPLRGGDVARGLVLSRETGMTRALALGTVALDKLFDMITLVVLVIPLLFLGGLPEWIRWPPVITVGAAAVLLAVGVLLRLRMRRRDDDLEDASWLVRVLTRFAAGFDSALRPGPAALCTLLSVLTYATLLGTMMLGLMSVGIHADPGTSIICILAVEFAAGIPVTPSAAGTMHGAIVAVLAALGKDPDTAMSAAVVYHAAQILPILVLGVVLTRGTALEQAADK